MWLWVYWGIMISEFHFGSDQGVHLVHVAGDPHHPHLDCHHDYRNLGYPEFPNSYFRLAAFLLSSEFSSTVLQTHQPAIMARISQIIEPVRRAPIAILYQYQYQLTRSLKSFVGKLGTTSPPPQRICQHSIPPNLQVWIVDLALALLQVVLKLLQLLHSLSFTLQPNCLFLALFVVLLVYFLELPQPFPQVTHPTASIVRNTPWTFVSRLLLKRSVILVVEVLILEVGNSEVLATAFFVVFLNCPYPGGWFLDIRGRVSKLWLHLLFWVGFD